MKDEKKNPESEDSWSGNSRNRMISEQIISRGIKDKLVLAAMKEVQRELFISVEYRSSAYDDRPLPIGMGQTISQPYIVALMTESLELAPDMKVLEIGTGSGYQTAILSKIAKEVYSVEINEQLYEKTREIFDSYQNVKLSNHDGSLGWEKYCPYDRIIVTAAPTYIPDSYIDQLDNTGVMVIPVGPSSWNQELYKIIKTRDRIKKIKICDVAFVPLTGKGMK